MLAAILLIPVLGAAAAVASPNDGFRRAVLVVTAIAHFVAVAMTWFFSVDSLLHGWIELDETGRLFLTVTSVLFFPAAVYTAGYLKRESGGKTKDYAEGFIFTNEPEALFISFLLMFLAAMSLTALSAHLGLLWVAIEATTLFSAPLIYFHRHHRSLEATWKYLLICSVGIALALPGNFFLAYAAQGRIANLTVAELMANAAMFDPVWLKAAFIFILVGYGVKMGLAPIHNWLPDAHSEAPSMVSALLSGSLLNCAFLGIYRSHGVLREAGLGRFSGDMLVMFGILSMAVAAVFIIRQKDFKRMLAYSSVEHMGIIALGVGLGGVGVGGGLLHMINHSLAKGMLFLVSGNILSLYRTKNVDKIGGLIKTSPITGALWMVGLFAITGTPPFGTFISEMVIFKAAVDAGSWKIAIAYLFILCVIFAAIGHIFIGMVFGKCRDDVCPAVEKAESAWAWMPPAFLAALALILGFYIPKAVSDILAISTSMEFP